MKIRVNSEGRRFLILLPNALFTNYLFCLIAHKELKKKGLDIPPDKLYAFMKAIKNYKKKHKDWTLVEVNSAGGDDVEIKM